MKNLLTPPSALESTFQAGTHIRMLAVFVRIFKSGGVRYRIADESAQPSHPMQASEAVALKCVILLSVPLAAMSPMDLGRFEVGQIWALHKEGFSHRQIAERATHGRTREFVTHPPAPRAPR